MKYDHNTNRQETFGLGHTQFYYAWRNLFPRCLDKDYPSYKCYGGRGITISPRWYNFKNFIDDMYEEYAYHLEKHGRRNTTLDRINNNKGYWPMNCRWATFKEQMNNRRDYRRMAMAKYILFRGKKLCISDWGKEFGHNYWWMRDKFKRGFTMDDIAKICKA